MVRHCRVTAKTTNIIPSHIVQNLFNTLVNTSLDLQPQKECYRIEYKTKNWEARLQLIIPKASMQTQCWTREDRLQFYHRLEYKGSKLTYYPFLAGSAYNHPVTYSISLPTSLYRLQETISFKSYCKWKSFWSYVQVAALRASDN